MLAVGTLPEVWVLVRLWKQQSMVPTAWTVIKETPDIIELSVSVTKSLLFEHSGDPCHYGITSYGSG